MPSKVERWLASQAKKQEGTATDKIRADRALDSGSEEFRVGAELDRYVGKASALAPYSPAPTTAEQPTYIEQTPLERKEQELVSAARQRAEKRKTAGDDFYKKEYGMTKAEYDKEYDAIDRMSAVREARSDMQEIEDTAKARTEEKVALAPLVKEYKDAFIGILPESAYASHSPVGDKEEIKEDIVLDYLMTLPAEERYAQLEKAAYRSTIVPRIEALKEKATQFMSEETERIREMQKYVPVPGYAAAAGMQLGAGGTWESPVEYLEDLYTSVKKDDFKSGFVEAADWRDFISFGLASLGGDAAKLQALQKAYKGEPLTEQDKFFIEVAEIEQALEDFRTEKGGASFLNSLGSGAAHSTQFLAEMAMTGGLGGAAKLATGGIKQAFKQGVGRGLAHLAVKNVPKTLAYGAKRSPLMAGTYRNLMDRRINQYSVANGQVDLTNPESLWKSIGVAWVDQTFEIASELWGNMLHLGFGKIGKAIGADKWLKTKSVNLKTTPAVRRVLRDGLLWSGDIPSEMTSEFLGDVATNLAYSAFNKDGQYWGELFTWNYWGNLLALTAGLKGGVTVASLPSIVASNKKMKQLEARSAEAFNAIGNEELKNKVLNLGGRTDIEDVAEYMHSINWSQYKPIEVAHAIDYMMSEVERQVVAGSESEQERAERYAPRLARIQELAYRNAEGVAMPTMVTADADNTQGVTILEGDYNNPEAMVSVLLGDGTMQPIIASKLSNVQETDMASLVAEDYAMTFAEEDAMETLGEVEQTLFDMQRTGASNTQQIRAVEKAGLTVFNEGEVVTLLNGEEATVVDGFRHGLYTVMRADGSLSMVGVGGILQPDVAIAQAQRSVAMPQEQTLLTQSAPLPEDIDTTTDYATPDGFVGKAVDYNAESDQVTLQSADGGLTNVPRASLTVANAEQITPQEDITENLATETISEMEQSEAEETPMPTIPEVAPIPQNEDGSVDYESMTDATMYANAIESDMGNVADAQEAVADVRQSKEAELAKLQEQKKQTANMNEKVALRQQEQKLVQQIAMLNEVESILGSRATAVEAETAQVNEAVETAPIAGATTEQTAPTTEPTRAEVEGVKDNYLATRLRNENPAEYNTFNVIAKLLGLEIEFVESAGEGNALIVGNKMQVAYNPANREETLRFLIGHESLHRLKQVAPEAYAELMEDVKSYIGEELFGQRVERLRVRYEHQGIAITEESLEEEVVADFIGEMEEGYNVVSNLATQNPNKSWWQKLIEGLRKLFSFLEEAEADTTKVASILNKIETAYKTAAEKVQTLEVESNANSDTQYSLKDEATDKIFATAKAKFGTTYDMREAGWILPDGSMLDFSGKHEIQDADTSFLNGRRTVDHRAIQDIAYDFDENKTGVKTDLGDFLDRGAIRIDDNAGSINLNVAPTKAQRDRLRRLIERNGGDVYIDFGKGWDTEHYVEYESARPSRVLGDIDRYFDEGIKPTGNVQYSLKEVNNRFNEQLATLTEENARESILNIGMPSPALLAAGITKKPIRLYGAKLLSKVRKHGYKIADLKDLPIALSEPIAVFTGSHDGSYAVLTELHIDDNNVLATLSIGKGGHDVDFNIISSVYDKREDSIARWVNNGKMLWVDKKKALDYFSDSAPLAEAQNNQELVSITKIVQNFENPNIEPKYSLKDTFYSNAEFAVRNIKQEKATPEQWLKMIEKNGGLKAGEDKWLGLSDWLKEQMRGSIKEKPTAININGTEYNVKELEEQILSDIKAMLGEAGFEDKLVGIRLVGSYARGEQRPDSDIDVIVEYKGNSTEDTLFNVLNDEEHRINIGGVDVDINPITEGKSGTLDEWEKRNAGFTKKPITLTKEEVLQYIAENDIQIEEVQYSETNAELLDRVGKLTNDLYYIEESINSLSESISKGKQRLKTLTDAKSVFDEKAETLKQEYGEDSPEYQNHIFYDSYTDDIESLEASITQDEEYYNTQSKRADALRSELEMLNEEVGDEREINSTRLQYTTKGLEDKREIALTVPTIEPWNTNDEIHFGDAGGGRAVAWIRFGETTDAEGKRVLVIDEIQSKRHQEGREKGYISDEVLEAQRQYDYLYNKMYREGLSEEEHNRYYFLGQFIKENYGIVPSAPFEKNWAELAMKRMLRYAAENGYDKVAWTKGDQQADRYNLGKMYDYIEREDNPNIKGKRFVLAGGNYDNFIVDDNAIVVSSSISEANGKPLTDVVGKDMAEKMMSLEDGDTVSGEGLRIGGEGMRAFYDQMLPSFVRKYAKKWGAAVGEVTMPNLEENNTMHSVDVTPAMRESVMQGQPMFSLRNPEWQSQFGVPLADGKELSLEDVRTIFGNTNSDTLLGEIFDRVYAVMEKLPRKVIKVVEELPDKRNVLGTASTKGDVTFRTVLFKNYGEQAIAETILHELIHSVTTYATHAYAKQATSEKHAKAYDALPTEIKKACRELQSIYNRLSKKNDLKGAYGIKNINEMLAELSNPEFRALVEEGGFWKVLLNAIKRMLGFDAKYNTELKELDNILSSFLENYNEEAYMDAVENIYGEDIFTTIEEVDAKETDNQGKEVKYSVKDKRKSAPKTVSVLKEHLQTAISSTDGTNVLKKIDTAIEKYKNDSYPKVKTFLGNLADILNAEKRGGKSQYATFEAMNGKVFTIRLSDHNATIKNFDDHNEKEGISIVITTGQNPGVNLGGDAHLVEFFYDAIKLRKAEGYPLVDILKSIKQALYSGEYKDTTGLAQVEEVNEPSYSLREATGERLTPAMIRHHMMENVTRHHEQEVNRINRFYDREERQAKALAKKARKEAGLVYPKNGKITDRLAFLIPDGKTTLPMELQVTYDIANGLKLKWSDSKDGRKHGLSSELGLGSSRKEGYGAITVGATMYVEDYVAQLMEENSGYSRDLDDNDIRNAVINVLSQYTKPKQAIQALEDIFLSNEMDDAEAEALYKIDLRRQEALEAENARYEGLKASYERNPRAFEREYFEQMEKDVVALNFKEREIRRLKRDIKALRNTHNKTYREQAERIQKVREAIDDFLKSTYGRNISTTEVKRLFDALQKATTQKQLERVIEAVSRMEKRTTDRIEQERKRRLLKMKLSFFIPADAISLEEYLKDENQKASDAAAIIDYYNTENSDPVMNTFRIALKDRYKGKDSSGVSVAKLIDAETAEIMAFISTNATRRDIVESNLAEETAKLYEAKEKLKGKLPFSQSTMDKIDQAYEVVLDYWEADIKRQGAVSYNKAMRELSIEIEIAKKKRDEAQLAGSDELYELAVAEVAGLMNEARELAESHYDGMGKANKILMEANDAVERLLLGGRRLLSEEREAKRKHDAEVLRDAINDITNYGEEYKELNAKAHDQRKASKDKEPSRLKRIHSEWADSLEYLLNVMAPYAPEGSGLTYQRIIGGALGAASTLYSNTQVVNMAVVGAIKRIWGGKMKHNTLPKLLNQSQQIVLAENYVIGYYEETEDGKKVKKPRRWCLTMGNAIYLLAMWEQPDSHYKLTANGVTQEVIDDVTSLIVDKDARWIEFKNWVVDELLPARREVYDETHRKVQGTYMAESKNYFPIHILSQDRHQEEKASEEKAQQRSIKPSGIKQRVYNTNMIDLNVDFVKALMDNLYTMEMWAAIAPVEEDMNVILSNNTAKNLMNAKFGADFSQRLKTAMQVTVGTLTSGYINSTEKFFQDLTRRWGGTKIAFGINTALKQLAGAGAMCVYTTDLRFLWYLAKNIQFLFTPKSAQEFFPMLQKRWEEGLAGNIGLKELFRSDVTTSSGFDIAEENVNRVTTDIVKLGMIPNKIVDMAVCAMMAKSVYEYEYNRYIKQGYSKDMAEKKAMIDAESSYNKTQQSSEMAFLSSGQVSSNILYRSLNIFMNNSIANYRIGVMGIEDIKRGLFRFKKAQRNMRKATERRLFEQYTASGMAEEEARVKAQEEADIIASKLSRISFVAKGFFRSLWGFYFANIVFGFMGIAPYLLFGDDDDKKEELIIDLLKSSVFTPLTLIPTTKAIYETFAYAWKRSEEGRGYQVSIAESLFPMLEDVDQLITNGVGVVADIADGGDVSYAQIYNTIDALLRMGVGVDTNRMLTITDGFIDLGNGDWLEGTLDVLSVPKSQIKLLTGDRKDGETAKEYMTRVMRTMSIVDKNKIDVAELEKYNFELGKWEKPTNISAAEKRKVSETYRQYQAEYKKDMLKRCSEEVRTDYPEVVEKHAEILKDMGVQDTKLALVKYYEQMEDTLTPEAASALNRLAVLQAEISATERSLDLMVSQDGKEYIELLTEEFNLRKEFVAQYEIYKNLTE